MSTEYTAERLMRLGADCNRDNRGASGLEIVRYAEAWEQERDALRAENEQAWKERNEAVNKVRAWENIVYVEGLPWRSAPGREWGPGGEDSVTVPEVTPAAAHRPT